VGLVQPFLAADGKGRPARTGLISNHEDAVIYLDTAGREGFVVAGAPNATGSPIATRSPIAPALREFLSSQGRADLARRSWPDP
jgi:hypothetical protein